MTAPLPSFPLARLRRLRREPWVRALVAEAHLRPQDLIWAIVVHDGPEPRVDVEGMPGAPRLSVAECARAAQAAQRLHIPAIAVFPHVDGRLKDPLGTGALDPDGLTARAVKAMKDASPGVGVIVDVALDAYTDHGHDGVFDGARVLNDETVARLTDMAVLLADAGADVIAPSDMMDGRVGAIRAALEQGGRGETLIMAYAAKYASAFYGPYRRAIGVERVIGDKRTYQMDPANGEEALRECALDLAEGADMLLVKPGLPYLDIVRRVKERFAAPTFAFQVSGEYAMVKAAAREGWLDEDRAILETLIAFKRAGADGVITYFAPRAAELAQGL